MTDDIQEIRDDIAYVRNLLGDDGTILFASGLGLVIAGIVFGLMVLREALIGGGFLQYPATLHQLMPWDAVVIFFVAFLGIGYYIKKVRGKFDTRPSAMTATARAMWAGWVAVGLGHLVASVGMSAAGTDLTGITLFAFWGGGWCVVWAVYRRAWIAAVALACYAVALATGHLWNTPYAGFIVAAGFVVGAVIPGMVLVRVARSYA
jgi:hypothetical protein